MKYIFLAALETEYIADTNSDVTIIYTGVGKINATISTFEVIQAYRPDLIINVGTAGSLREDLLGQAVLIKDVLERDMLAMPLAPRGQVPFSSDATLLSSWHGNFRCATGDSFVSSKDEWLFENQVDVVDMELFAIAKTCAKNNIPWLSIKFITDLSDEDAAKNWSGSVVNAKLSIQDKLDSLISLLN